MIRSLIFDFDGLIVDTETPIVEAWVQVHERAGIAYSRDHALSIVGHADMDYDPWIAFGATADRVTLDKEHRQLHHQLLYVQPILPGVLELIASARERGLRLGIASNSPHIWVDKHLERIGLRQYFDVVRCRDDVSRGKPEPEIYLSALHALDTPPSAAVAFEDSLPGSEAASRAGIFCVVAPNPSTRHHTFPHASLRVESLAEVNLERLTRALCGSDSADK
jgi:HAD superfamily hydrolase (TIGR01509 family)